MVLYMYIAPGQGQRVPWGQVLMSTEMSCHFIYFVSLKKKKSLKSDFIHFFHNLIHLCSPGAGADSPQATKF